MDDEDFDGDTIEIVDEMDGSYEPCWMHHIMKDVFTKLAKAMPTEPFSAYVESGGTYDDCTISAEYDGEILTYSFTYGEIGWNEIQCSECGFEGCVEDVNENGFVVCPDCGVEISKPDNFEKGELEIEIN